MRSPRDGVFTGVSLARGEPTAPGAGLHDMPATLHFSLRDSWRELKRGRPGHRFQDRYERTRRAEPRCGVAKRIATLAVAAVAIAIGLVLAVIPGPAIPFFVISGALLATQSRTMARAMDWLELRGRDALAWLKRRWRHLPRGGRIAVAFFGISCSATLAYATYRLFRG